MTFHSSFKTWLGKVAPVLLLPVLFLAAQSAFAQSAEVRSRGVYYKNTASGFGINDVYCNWKTANLTDADYKGGIVNVAGKNTSDPWQTSALIEYDQPYPSPTENNSYPNHCLGLCMDVYCTNKPNGSATYSVAFPIQNVRFEIAKYYASNDIGNPEKSPAVRTIDMSLQNNYITDADPALSDLLQVARPSLKETCAHICIPGSVATGSRWVPRSAISDSHHGVPSEGREDNSGGFKLDTLLPPGVSTEGI